MFYSVESFSFAHKDKRPEVFCLADKEQFLRRHLKNSGSFKKQNLLTSAYFRGATQLYFKAGFSPLDYSRNKMENLLRKKKNVARNLVGTRCGELLQEHCRQHEGHGHTSPHDCTY